MVGLLENPQIYSTVRVSLIDRDTGEWTDCIYDYAAEYADVMNDALKSFASQNPSAGNLMNDFELKDDKDLELRIKSKVSQAVPTVCAAGDLLVAAVRLQMSDDLTYEEYDALVGAIQHQYEYGWGSEFELLDIAINDSEAVCLRLYHPEVEFYLPGFGPTPCAPDHSRPQL